MAHYDGTAEEIL